MMAKLLFSTVVLLLVQYALGQVMDASQPDSSKYPAQDPVSVMMAEMGHLLLGVDEAYSKQTAHKVDYQDRMKEQIDGQQRSEYFDRIREKYRKLPRMGLIPLNDVSVSSNLFGVKVKNEGQASAVDVSIPSLPIQLQVRSKVPTVEEYSSGNGERFTKVPESNFASKMKLGNTELKIDSKFVLPEVSLTTEQMGKGHESRSKNEDNAEAPKSRFSSKLKVGDSEINIGSLFSLPDTLDTKLNRRVPQSGPKEFDIDEVFATKVPMSRFSNKIKMQNSAVKLNSQFAIPDTSIKTERIGSVLESDSQVLDSAEIFARNEPKSLSASKIEVEDSQTDTDSALALPDTTSEERDILNSKYLIVLGNSGDDDKRGKRTPPLEKADDERVAIFTKTYKDYLSDTNKQNQPWDIYTKGRGRILGDLLFSESMFDQLTKEALRNAKWILDSDLSPRKVLEKLGEISKLVLTRRSSEGFVAQGRDWEANRNPNKDDTSDILRRSGVEKASGSADLVLPDFPELECSENKVRKSSNSDLVEETFKESNMSAITNDGVLVKLRVGSELGNPYVFLHKILSAAEVTLNVEMTPKCSVSSTDILKSESVKMPAQSLSIDLSNENQRDSFLMTLRKFKDGK